jgi:hypothetical protein
MVWRTRVVQHLETAGCQCLGTRAHCNAAEWHGSHGYSGVSVAHDMCMRMRSCACLCGIACTCLCCHGLRCGSESSSGSRRPGHGRPDSPPFSVSPCHCGTIWLLPDQKLSVTVEHSPLTVEHSPTSLGGLCDIWGRLRPVTAC